MEILGFPLYLNIILFISAAGLVSIAGWNLAHAADRLADRTGLGEAITGMVLLGAATSLSGIVTSTGAAHQGYAELAVSNATGGIAIQTIFLVLADITYRKANLEHAAASVTNLLQGSLLLILLAVPVLAAVGPSVHIQGIHPASPIMFLIYIYGINIVKRTKDQPMWAPRRTKETKEDITKEGKEGETLTNIIIRFVSFAILIGISGWLIVANGIAITEKTGLSETLVGGLFTAAATSLPELVTTVAAVRQGALTLAVSNIIGGNAFDTLFLAVSDIAYRSGSIYHAITMNQIFFIMLTIIMSATLVMGLLHREKHGIANIGFESFAIIVLYLGAVAFLFFV